MRPIHHRFSMSSFKILTCNLFKMTECNFFTKYIAFVDELLDFVMPWANVCRHCWWLEELLCAKYGGWDGWRRTERGCCCCSTAGLWMTMNFSHMCVHATVSRSVPEWMLKIFPCYTLLYCVIVFWQHLLLELYIGIIKAQQFIEMMQMEV